MEQPKIGVALGAGSARGLAHIGVLQVFEEHNIPVHVVAGTSMGAVIGGLYAAGIDLKLLARMAMELKWDDLVRLTITKMGMVSSERIYEMLRVLTRNQHFSDLSIKTAVVACDINSGEEVVIDEGLLAAGMRASMSIPGIFVPVTAKDRMLVDGALANRVPASVARNLGAEIVIGVDVGFADFRGRVRNLPDIIMRVIDILERECSKLRPSGADLVIAPNLSDVTSTQLNRAEEIIAEGRRAAEERIGEINRLLKEKESGSG